MLRPRRGKVGTSQIPNRSIWFGPGCQKRVRRRAAAPISRPCSSMTAPCSELIDRKKVITAAFLRCTVGVPRGLSNGGPPPDGERHVQKTRVLGRRVVQDPPPHPFGKAGTEAVIGATSFSHQLPVTGVCVLP